MDSSSTASGYMSKELPSFLDDEGLLGSATAFSRSFVWLSPSTPFGSAMTTSSSNNGGRPLSEFSLRLLGSRSFEPLPPNMDEMRKMRERKQQQKDFIVTHLGSRSYEPLPLNMAHGSAMTSSSSNDGWLPPPKFSLRLHGSRSFELLPPNTTQHLLGPAKGTSLSAICKTFFSRSGVLGPTRPKHGQK